MRIMEPSLKPHYLIKGKNFKNYISRGVKFKPKSLGGLYLSTNNSFGRSEIRKAYRHGLKKWAKRNTRYY